MLYGSAYTDVYSHHRSQEWTHEQVADAASGATIISGAMSGG